MAFLTPDNIRTEHGLIIKEKIIPWGARWPKSYRSYDKGDLFKADRKLSGGSGKVQYVTIHNTDDIEEARGTNDAEQYTRATWPNANMGDSRVHYFIDETDCWQNLREDEVGWHAGDGRGPGNESSLAIEIIMDGSGSAADKAAEDRGALLAAILLNKHGLGIDRLTTHQRWSGKKCPIYILPHWSTFRTTVEKYLKQIQGGASATEKPATEPDTNGTLYRVQVGAFKVKANAEAQLAKLKAAGFSTYLVKVDGLYKIQTGAYSKKANAQTQLAKVKAAGFSAFITTKGGEAVAPAPAKTITEGSTVRVKHGAKTYAGGSLASFIYNRDHIAEEIDGDRVVITYKGTVVAAVRLADLTLA